MQLCLGGGHQRFRKREKSLLILEKSSEDRSMVCDFWVCILSHPLLCRYRQTTQENWMCCAGCCHGLSSPTWKSQGWPQRSWALAVAHLGTSSLRLGPWIEPSSWQQMVVRRARVVCGTWEDLGVEAERGVNPQEDKTGVHNRELVAGGKVAEFTTWWNLGCVYKESY